MTFSLAQSSSNIFVFSVLHFTTYTLLGITLNLSDLIHFFLLKKKKNPQKLFSEQLYCLPSAGCDSKPPASKTACSHYRYRSNLHIWVMFPWRWQSVLSPVAGERRSCSVHPSPAFLLPAIVHLLLHLWSRRGRELCPQVGLGQLLLSWRLEMLHPCSIFQGTWFVKSSSLGSACPRQQTGSLASCPWNAFPTGV